MKHSFFIILFAALLWLFCSEYNPFENPANINVVVVAEKSSLQRDSATNIFTTETLTVIATVREKIDSFTIHAPTNRYWTKQTITAPIADGEYIFLFSYNDSGSATVLLNTYRNNGDIIPQEFSLKINNPLAQSPITIEQGTDFVLSTPAVSDFDTRYHWKFFKESGQPLTFSNATSNYTAQINEPLSGDTGYLWVEDTAGNTSPLTPFTYSTIDTTGPVILCLNKGPIGDTLISGAGTFVFKVECNDGQGIGGALINNENFSDSTLNIKATTYYKTLFNLDTLSGYFLVAVNAWDAKNNHRRDTFFIRYDSNGPKEIITLKNPPTSYYTTNQNPFTIVATVFNPLDTSVTVTIHHREYDSTHLIDTIVKETEQDISFATSLQQGTNTLFINVLDTSNSVIAKDSVFLTFTSGTIVDSIPPFINRITVNGKEGRQHFLPENYAVLALEAFDEQMDSVLINNTLKSAEPGHRFLWKDTLALNDSTQFFYIHLIDKMGNRTFDTVEVQRNNLPKITTPVSWPRTLVVGRPWYKEFNVADPNRDLVSIIHYPDPKSALPEPGAITFSQIGPNRWSVFWRGQLSNSSGLNKLHKTFVVLYDEKEYMPYPWNFSIKDSTQAQDYHFQVFLPDGIDSTALGAIDISTATEPVNVFCIVVADAKPFSDRDIITVLREDQAISFPATASDTNWFHLSLVPEEIKGNKESMLIMVTDSNDVATLVDTLVVIYSWDFPGHIDELGWLLNADEGITLKEDFVAHWETEAFELNTNSYTNELYDRKTMPRYVENAISDYAALKFSPLEHSNLLNSEENWLSTPFTLFFVTRLALTTPKDSGKVIISAGPDNKFIGLGVFDGLMGIYGSLGNGGYRDTTITCNIKVTKNAWHILCYSSKQGMGNGSTPFDLSFWIDGEAHPNNTISLPNAGGQGNMNYLILGGGGKHTALKNWDGHIAEIVKYCKYLTDEERLAVQRYLGSKFKIKL